jgi:hypothetical protein
MDSKVKIEIVDGPGGYSLYINDTRVAGPKPLGGGRLVKAFGVKADELISLLDAQRCEWTHNAEYYPNLYHTSCGKVLSEDSPEQRPFCPCCGRRIEVKDGQG